MKNRCYCIALRKASRKVSLLYDHALAEFGITVAQYSLMRKLQTGKPLTVTELAERLELDRSTVGRNVKVLERKGLIHIKKGDDLREARVHLTQDGGFILDTSQPKWQQVQDTVEAKLGHHGIQQLLALTNGL